MPMNVLGERLRLVIGLAGTRCPDGPDTPVGVANGTVQVTQRRSRKLRI